MNLYTTAPVAAAAVLLLAMAWTLLGAVGDGPLPSAVATGPSVMLLDAGGL